MGDLRAPDSERTAESMHGGLNPYPPEQHRHAHVAERLRRPPRKNVRAPAARLMLGFEDGDCRVREGNTVFFARLHPLLRDRPDRLVEIHLVERRAENLRRPARGQDGEPQRKAATTGVSAERELQRPSAATGAGRQWQQRHRASVNIHLAPVIIVRSGAYF
jgi:hypothetical protein